MKDFLFMTISSDAQTWCRRAVEACGKAAGINNLYAEVYAWSNHGIIRYKIYRADVKKLTLALRLYKVVHGDLGYFYSIDLIVQELEEAWEKGRPGHEKNQMPNSGGREIQINDDMV